MCEGRGGCQVDHMHSPGHLSFEYKDGDLKDEIGQMRALSTAFTRLANALEGVPSDCHKPNPSVAAIDFALTCGLGDGGLEFLRAWQSGEFDAIRDEWPEAPDAVFAGADPLHRAS